MKDCLRYIKSILCSLRFLTDRSGFSILPLHFLKCKPKLSVHQFHLMRLKKFPKVEELLASYFKNRGLSDTKDKKVLSWRENSKLNFRTVNFWTEIYFTKGCKNYIIGGSSRFCAL